MKRETLGAGDPADDLTLAELVAAVIDVADDERQVAPVVLAMLRRGTVRLRRPPRARLVLAR
ncbi:MAG TPA: hypothetical protein VLC53_17200 [Myxococcota bacterium]|nr:hypothetical protein [Myxococcota bacterium]